MPDAAQRCGRGERVAVVVERGAQMRPAAADLEQLDVVDLRRVPGRLAAGGIRRGEHVADVIDGSAEVRSGAGQPVEADLAGDVRRRARLERDAVPGGSLRRTGRPEHPISTDRDTEPDLRAGQPVVERLQVFDVEALRPSPARRRRGGSARRDDCGQRRQREDSQHCDQPAARRFRRIHQRRSPKRSVQSRPVPRGSGSRIIVRASRQLNVRSAGEVGRRRPAEQWRDRRHGVRELLERRTVESLRPVAQR